MVKLVAFDVDGTLRDRDVLPESTREALKKLKDQGIVLALCTGRSEFEMASLREELGIDWAVTCNGGHVGYQGKTVFGGAFDSATIRTWAEIAEQSNHGMILYGSELMFANRPDAPLFLRARDEIGFMNPVPFDVRDELPGIYQCILFCQEQEESYYFGEERDQYYVHRWRPWATDVNPIGTNKAVGLLRLLEHLGIRPEETAAFGDGLNDLEMLERVGIGIAMGNGGDEVKRRARFVTKPMLEDGIAYAVERWILPQAVLKNGY